MSDINNSQNVFNKYNIVKYLFLVFSCIFSVFMFFKWFDIFYLSSEETHSFITMTSLVNENIETFKSLLGNSASFTILLFVGSLEYLCIMSAALGIWGIIRSFVKEKRSRILLASQIIAFVLTVIALSTIILINYVSSKLLGGLVDIYPTVYLVICLVALVASTILGSVYSRYTEPAYQDE